MPLSLINKIPHITIPKPDGSPYLTRYYLFWKDREFGNAFLHEFHSSDLDQEDEVFLLHNHPFRWSYSLVLTNGYFEWRRYKSDSEDSEHGYEVRWRFVKPWSINFISDTVFHRVQLKDNKKVWTLFITGPRKGSWGFWNRKTNVFKDYKHYAKAVA